MATKAKPKTIKKKQQHTPDYYPVQRTIPLSGTTAANGQIVSATMSADAGRLLSQSNRRLYRYGMNYRIKLDLDLSESVAVPVDVEVYALRNNWDVQRAFALAKKHYDAAIADELSTIDSARWLDFRILNGVTGAIDLHPVTIDNATLAVNVDDEGEHSASLVDDGGTGKNFTWGVAGGSTLSVRDEWINSGRTSNDPSTVSSNAPYDGLNSDSMSDLEFTALQNRGDAPPYRNTSDSDLLHKVGTLRYEPAPGALQRLSTGYFDAPCGLFVIKVTTGVNLGPGSVVMTAQSGDYKGIAADKMCQ